MKEQNLGEPALNDDTIVAYLRHNPAFFLRHPAVFTELQLPDPHQGKAVSLVERQVALLRERVQALELRLEELLRIGRENDGLARLLVDWSSALLAEPAARRRPAVAADALRRIFGVPLAEIRLWSSAPAAADAALAHWAVSLSAPACGAGTELRALTELATAWEGARSVAVVPLRSAEGQAPFGILALGSSDPARFDTSLGTAVLARIGELASAALASLPTV